MEAHSHSSTHTHTLLSTHASTHKLYKQAQTKESNHKIKNNATLNLTTDLLF